MSISTWFIAKPIGTSLIMAGIVAVGVTAYPALPVAPLPQVEFPTIQVSAQLPGGSPETLAATVTQPLERQFGQIPGVSQMTSTSTAGYSSITLQFDLSRDIDGAALDVQTAINAASGQLPSNLPAAPTYRKVNPADAPVLVLALTSDTLPLTQIDDIAENTLAQRISQVSGVAQVSVFGQQKPAIRIQVDPTKLAAVGLSLEDLRTTIVATSTNAPKGSIQGTSRTFTIYDNDQITKATTWSDAIVAYRDGAPIRLRDIGQVVEAAENAQLAAWANNKPAIILPVFKMPGANVIETVGSIKAQLPALRAALPPALDIAVISDRTTTIRASVLDVERTLLITIGLVVMVIFLFLRNVWATVIPSVSVPLAIVGTFAIMYPLGYSLDNLSLMGLSIAVGFVVDDAIVMLENIQRHLEMGKSPEQAARDGAGEINFTIISISLSLVAVFIPLLLLGGVVGRLFREFAVVVTLAIVVSGFVSLSLTPMMCARFLKPEPIARGLLYRATEPMFQGLLAGYRVTLDIALRHKLVTLIVFLATVAATGTLFARIPKGFFPVQDTGLIVGISEAAQNISFEEMAKRQLALSRVVLADHDVATVGMTIGATGGQTLNNGRLFITLKPREQRQSSASQIIERLREPLAGVEGAALFLQPAQDINIGGRLSRTQFQYTLQSLDPMELDAWAPRLLAKLRTLPQLADVATDQQNGGTALTLQINRAEAARYGIRPDLIDATLYDAFGPRQVAQYFTQLNSYHVILELLPGQQHSPAALDNVFIRSPTTGGQVPLSVLVSASTETPAVLAVNHQSQFPSVTLSFNLGPGVALSEAITAVRQAERELGTPPTLQGTFQGNAQAFQSSLATMPYLIAAALLVIYVILGVLYESYLHPLTILSTLPSAGVGALVMLSLFGFDFSIIALIGVILLIGIVKKNGIMLVDFAVAAERERKLDPQAAIREACHLRFRPILMTTLAALLGGVPLMIGSGTGSELRQPLGYAMVGGLLMSQILTLYTTPVVYIYLSRLNRRVAKKG